MKKKKKKKKEELKTEPVKEGEKKRGRTEDRTVKKKRPVERKSQRSKVAAVGSSLCV